MPVRDIFEIPKIKSRSSRLSPTPKPSRDIGSAEEVRAIAATAVQDYLSLASRGRWRILPETNKAILDCAIWWSSNMNGRPWPSDLYRALAHGLGIYKRVQLRNSAGLAAREEGRILARRQFTRTGILAPTAADLAVRYQVSPAMVNSWRRSPGYRERREASRKAQIEMESRERRGGSRGIVWPAQVDKIHIEAAVNAAAQPLATIEQRLVVFHVISRWTGGGHSLTDPLARVLALSLRVTSNKFKKIAYSGS